MPVNAAVFALLMLFAVLAGCSTADEEPSGRPSATREPTPRSTPTEEPPSPTPTRPPRPAYRSSVRPLTTDERAAMTGVSWRPGCPLPLERLRVVTLRHWDFAGRLRQGVLIVRDDVAEEVGRIFGRLFRDRFPIRRMEPVDRYDGDDFASIEADNTSAFNCRPAAGSTRWSHHAYGLAVDVNPIENPYVLDGRTIHPASVRFLDRDRERPGMLVEGGKAVRAFTVAGWHWGGEWSDPVDYQHFSKLPQDTDPGIAD